MTRLVKNPGESFEDFIARVVATAEPPSERELNDLWRLLPPTTAVDQQAAA